MRGRSDGLGTMRGGASLAASQFFSFFFGGGGGGGGRGKTPSQKKRKTGWLARLGRNDGLGTRLDTRLWPVPGVVSPEEGCMRLSVTVRGRERAVEGSPASWLPSRARD